MPATTMTPAVATMGGHVGRRVLGRVDSPLTLRQAASAGGEEDRVVGDDSEGERDDERLDLLRHGGVERLADPGDEAGREEKGDRRGEEHQEGSADRAERDSHDERDEPDRASLDDREGAFDLLELLPACGRRPVTPTSPSSGAEASAA